MMFPLTVHDCRLAEIRQKSRDGGSGDTERQLDDGSGELKPGMDMERQLDDGCDELKPVMDMERQLDAGSGELKPVLDMERQLDAGSGELKPVLDMERQLDAGSGKSELEMDMERQLDGGSGKPGLETKTEKKLMIGMCPFKYCFYMFHFFKQSATKRLVLRRVSLIQISEYYQITRRKELVTGKEKTGS